MTMGNILAALGLVAIASTATAAAQTQTALKIGELTTGQTKQCIYQALGNEYTTTINVGEICPPRITVSLPATATPSMPLPPLTAPEPTTVTAFKTGESTMGETKQCYYEALGNVFTQTVRSNEACPPSITAMIDSGCGRTNLETCVRRDTSTAGSAESNAAFTPPSPATVPRRHPFI